jgi:TolB-like protein/DNA-binding LytR/AlgR family response regulator/Flp pilus assembly protein TadD
MIAILIIQPRRSAGATTLRSHLAAHRDVSIVGEAHDAAQARAQLALENYDVAFLDLQLSRSDAFELVPALRRGARIVFLTTDTPATLQALEAGGAEYLLKPVSAASVARVLQKARSSASSGAPFASASLVPVKTGALTRLLRVDDVLLVTASENYTEVTQAAGERVFLRRTMQQWAELLPPRQFARVHRGLFLNLARIGRIERTSDGATRLHFTGDIPAPVDVKRRHWPELRARLEAWRTLARPASTPSGGEKSIAVLPFTNLSGDPANETFCDGISEELLNVLAKIPALRVAARTSAFYFKGKTAPIGEIARQLGVDYIVEGSVRKTATRARITAQLVRAADGFHTWSHNFDRELTDILAVQDEIAAEVAANLQLKLGGAGRTTATVDPRAHWLTLEGRHFWSLRMQDGFTRAEAAFTKALAIDAGYAPAHAGLADVWSVRALYRLADGALDVADDLLRARSAARRALKIDPTLAEPHATLGLVAFSEGNFTEAEREFPMAFALNPNYATAYQFYAWIVCAQGRLDQALVGYARSIDRDPLSFINIDRYAAMLALAGRYEQALAANERAATLRPDPFVGNLSQRAPILLALGRRDEAVAVAREVRRLAPAHPFRRNSDADAVFVLQQAGLVEEAAEYALEILQTLPRQNYLRGFILGALGRHESALPWLQHTPSIMLPQLYFSPMWDGVRDEASFHDLIAKLGRTREYQIARDTRRLMLAPSAAPKEAPGECRPRRRR